MFLTNELVSGSTLCEYVLQNTPVLGRCIITVLIFMVFHLVTNIIKQEAPRFVAVFSSLSKFSAQNLMSFVESKKKRWKSAWYACKFSHKICVY